MHPIDRAAAVMMQRGPDRLRIFPDGWGRQSYVTQLGNALLLSAEPPHLDVAWAPTTHLVDRTVRDGRYLAPTDVPSPARTGAVRLIEPAAGTERMCLLVAAWNDHGYTTREKLATKLLDRGIGSLILENPYYGSRRITPEGQPAVPTVADFARMGLGADAIVDSFDRLELA